MKKLFVTAALVLASASSFASHVDGTVKIVGCDYNGDTCYAYLDQTIPNPAGCAGSDSIRFDRTKANADKIFSMLMASKVTGKQVRVLLNGSECHGSFPKPAYVNF